jgi:hypothetical protein
MANRHKAFKKGGKVPYDGAKSNVMKEAVKKNTGGTVSVGSPVGKKSGGRLDKFARGGVVKGGGGDCSKSPFSAAHVRTNGDA